MKPINIKKKINIYIGSSTTNGKGKKFIFTISLLLIENKEQKKQLAHLLKFRIADANKVPLGLGRQLDDAKPWGEPARFFSKKK